MRRFRHTITHLIALAALLAPLTASAEEPTRRAARLRQVETEISDLEQRLADIQSPAAMDQAGMVMARSRLRMARRLLSVNNDRYAHVLAQDVARRLKPTGGRKVNQ